MCQLADSRKPAGCQRGSKQLSAAGKASCSPPWSALLELARRVAWPSVHVQRRSRPSESASSLDGISWHSPGTGWFLLEINYQAENNKEATCTHRVSNFHRRVLNNLPGVSGWAKPFEYPKLVRRNKVSYDLGTTNIAAAICVFLQTDIFVTMLEPSK